MANIIRPLEINKPSWLQRLGLRPFRGVKAAPTTPQNPVPVSASQLASQQHSLQITPAVPARVDPPQLLYQGNTGIEGAKNAIKRYFATIEPAQRLTERFSAGLFKSSLLLPLQGVMTTGLLLLGANLLPLAGLGLAAGLAGSLLPLAITAISVRLVDRSRAAKAAREINRFDHDLLAEAISELKTGDREMIYRVADQNKRGMIAQRVAAVDSGCVIVRDEWIEEQEPVGPEPEPAAVKVDVPRGAWRRLLERFVKQMRTPYRNIRTFIELLPESELKANLDHCFRDKVVYLADVVALLEGDVRSVIGADAALWRAWDAAYEQAVSRMKALDPDFAHDRAQQRQVEQAPEPSHPGMVTVRLDHIGSTLPQALGEPVAASRPSLIDIVSYSPGRPVEMGDTLVVPNQVELAGRSHIRSIMREVINDLRHDRRPTLVGRIAGLTETMEQVFRMGLISIAELPDGDIWAIETLGGETMCGGAWHKIGLSGHPPIEERRIALRAFNEWTRAQVELLNGGLEPAFAAAQKELTVPFGVEVVNPRSAGQIYYAIESLLILPRSVLGSAIKRINYSASRDRAARFAQYVEERSEVGLIHNPVEFDRYLFTALLFHEYGHAVMRILSGEQLVGFKNIYNEFWKNKAVFGMDFMLFGSQERISYQGDFKEFFAENFMHFIVLGRGKMTGQGPHAELRGRLYDLYASLYGAQEFDILEQLAA